MKKLLWIDNLRGFLILLVILGHCIQNTNPNYQSDILFRYIYSFHMPLFIFVSGYVSYKEKIEWISIRKRFFQLIIPFSVWTCLSAISSLNVSVIFDDILHPEKGLWFLWALFFISVINTLCCRISYKTSASEEVINIIAATVLIITMRKFSYFCYPTIAKFFLFYIGGFFIRKHSMFFARYRKSIITPSLFLFVISAYFFQWGDIPSFMKVGVNSFYGIVYNTCVAAFAIVGFMALFQSYFDGHLIISKLGGVTLGMYAIHRPIMSLFPIGFINANEPLFYYIEIIVLWVVVSFLSYYAVLLIDKNRYMSFLLNGKRTK